MFCIAMAQRFVMWIIIMELHHRKGLFGFFSECILDFPLHSFPYGQLCSDLCFHSS